VSLKVRAIPALSVNTAGVNVRVITPGIAVKN